MIEKDSEKVEPVVERVRKSMDSKCLKKKIHTLNDSEIEYGEEPFMKLNKVRCEVAT